MGLDPRLVAEFRGRLNRSRETNQEAWNLSRRLVGPSNLQATLKQLAEAIRASSLPPSVRDALLSGLCDGTAERVLVLPGDALRQLNGLSPTKAVRALCVLFGLETVKGRRPCYAIVTCHAPATPAFAHETTRVSRSIIDAHLRKTKGQFRAVRVQREEALEVMHAGRSLLFPPWKFEVRGPLALLDLLSRRGQLGVLSAVDSEVFWEFLSQLLGDARLRPPDVIFTPSIIADVFGAIHARLAALPVGGSVVLSDVT